MVEGRFIELEKKVAFQDAAIDELREAIDLQQKRINLLEAELRMVKDKVVSENPIRDIEDEEPPPHY